MTREEKLAAMTALFADFVRQMREQFPADGDVFATVLLKTVAKLCDTKSLQVGAIVFFAQSWGIAVQQKQRHRPLRTHGRRHS